MDSRKQVFEQMWRLAARMILFACLVGSTAAATAAIADDQFIQGYAAAILEQQFKAKTGSLQVTNGVITVNATDLGTADREKIVTTLKEIRGVVRVDVIEVDKKEPPLALRKPEAGQAVELGETKPRGGEFLPEGRLFEPLIADPFWPRFSAAYQHYVDDEELQNVAAVTVGAIVGVYEGNFFAGGRWQAGVQANVAAIFDLDAPSSDLVNADYSLGLPLSYRVKNFSAILRVFHQSSHLGDEFILRTGTDRVNLSYEGADACLSYDFFKKTVRLYGGGGYLFRRNPDDLKPWSAQGGLEVRSPYAFFGKVVRPIAGADIRAREETDWDLDVSVRVGLQFETKKLRGRYLQLMAEYYNGHSPHGQFFERNIEYFGIGLQFYFD